MFAPNVDVILKASVSSDALDFLCTIADGDYPN